MENRPKLDELRQRLAAAGAPADYVERLAGEVEDHLADAMDAALVAGKNVEEARVLARERVGDLSVLAGEAVRNVGGWRMPRAALLALAVVVVPAVWVGFVVVTVGLGALAADALGVSPRSVVGGLYLQGVYLTSQYVIPVAVAAGIFQLSRARWIGAGWGWIAAAVALLAGSMLGLALRFPASPGDEGALIAGLAPSPDGPRLAVMAGCVAVYALLRRSRAGWPAPAFS